LVQAASRKMNYRIRVWPNRDPLEEQAGINIYGFVCNNVINRFDVNGLWEDNGVGGVVDDRNCQDSLELEFVPKAELGSAWTRWKNELCNTLYFEGPDAANSASQKISDTYSKYDPDGDCCKGHCIKHLIISAHGGAGAIEFNLGQQSLNWANFKWNQYATNGVPQGYHGFTLQSIQSHLSQLALLKQIGSKLCNNATVSFVVCGLAQGGAGQAMREMMQSIFPAGTTIQMSENFCGMDWGNPVTGTDENNLNQPYP